jgi:hypothetical protein
VDCRLILSATSHAPTPRGERPRATARCTAQWRRGRAAVLPRRAAGACRGQDVSRVTRKGRHPNRNSAASANCHTSRPSRCAARTPAPIAPWHAGGRGACPQSFRPPLLSMMRRERRARARPSGGWWKGPGRMAERRLLSSEEIRRLRKPTSRQVWRLRLLERSRIWRPQSATALAAFADRRGMLV